MTAPARTTERARRVATFIATKNIGASSSSPMLSAAMATSDSAMGPLGSARPSPRAATHTGTSPNRYSKPGDPARTATPRSTPHWPAHAPCSTPEVKATHKAVVAELGELTGRVDICIDQHLRPDRREYNRHRHSHVELIIVDEADRLTPSALEYLRDRFDRHHLALLLIGMPGIEKRLAAYPQLYSRIGFAHRYRPLSNDELTFVLTRHWRRLGLTLDLDDFTDTQAIAAAACITRGNFRLLHRLFTQVDRIMKINGLRTITLEVIEAARSTLVIGAE